MFIFVLTSVLDSVTVLIEDVIQDYWKKEIENDLPYLSVLFIHQDSKLDNSLNFSEIVFSKKQDMFYLKK